MHESGVHATIAGVALGLLCPARPVDGRNVLTTLEHRLHPVSAFVVVPLFALANAGIDLGAKNLEDALESRSCARSSWLVIGKLTGISAATLLTLRQGTGQPARGSRAPSRPGIAALGGIGFTVSLFIAELAYGEDELANIAKIGILGASPACWARRCCGASRGAYRRRRRGARHHRQFGGACGEGDRVLAGPSDAATTGRSLVVDRPHARRGRACPRHGLPGLEQHDRDPAAV